MKKLFLGSIALTVFSIAILIFQISCQKTVDAQQSGSNYVLPAATTTNLGGVIVGQGLTVSANGTLSVSTTSSTTGLQQLNKIVYRKRNSDGTLDEIWTANYDGTNQTKINITLPTGIVFGESMRPFLSPDGKKVFFTGAVSPRISSEDVYSANIDGTNVTKIIDKGGDQNNINIGGAY